MSKGKYIRVKQDDRLVRKLRRPGGLTPAQAIAKANECLESAKEYLSSSLDERIDGLPTGALTSEQIPALYAEAAEILSVAGTIRAEQMSQAARSLCDLFDVGGNAVRDGFKPQYDPRVLQVAQLHVDTIRVIHREDMRANPATCQALIAGLQEATRKIM